MNHHFLSILIFTLAFLPLVAFATNQTLTINSNGLVVNTVPLITLTNNVLINANLKATTITGNGSGVTNVNALNAGIATNDSYGNFLNLNSTNVATYLYTFSGQTLLPSLLNIYYTDPSNNCLLGFGSGGWGANGGFTFHMGGYRNTGVGVNVLQDMSVGNDNSAYGFESVWNLEMGSNNCAYGSQVGGEMVNASSDNTLLGFSSAFNANDTSGPLLLENTFVGSKSAYNYVYGTNNIALGYMAGSSWVHNSNNIAIGNIGASGDNGTIRIGTAGIQTNTIIAGVINGNGSQLTGLNALLFNQLVASAVTNGDPSRFNISTYTNVSGPSGLSTMSLNYGTTPEITWQWGSGTAGHTMNITSPYYGTSFAMGLAGTISMGSSTNYLSIAGSGLTLLSASGAQILMPSGSSEFDFDNGPISMTGAVGSAMYGPGWWWTTNAGVVTTLTNGTYSMTNWVTGNYSSISNNGNVYANGVLLGGGGGSIPNNLVTNNSATQDWTNNQTIYTTGSNPFILSSGGGIDFQFLPLFGRWDLEVSSSHFEITSGGTSVQMALWDGSGNLQNTGTISVNAPTTSVSGSTSGSATFVEPEQGSAFKRVVINCSALLGTASFSFPTAFVSTPVVLTTSGLSPSLVTTISTSAVTVTGSTSTGILILEGQ